ncbi:PKD domain-containing protein [Streptomyces phytophilus]|uniref:PKD domain-containing protein n=1 Tax=Streptomyces phytophilus TaxID=722715 RepID=UPI0015F0B50F|nr:PKD domain-containing protein [Streptomyces phytophilus]
MGVSEARERNAAPRARIQESGDGARVTLDAGGSTDEDGRIKKYLWEFADGAVVEGRRLSRPAGAAELSGLKLLVVDDRGEARPRQR